MGSNAPGWIALGIAGATLLWTMFWSVFQNRRTTNPRLHVRAAFSIPVMAGRLGPNQLGVEVNNTGPVPCKLLSVVLQVRGRQERVVPPWSLQTPGQLPITLEPGSGHWTGLIGMEQLRSGLDGKQVRAVVRIAGDREFRSRVESRFGFRRRWFKV